MFVRPSSNLLCGHKPNSFLSFHAQSPSSPINNLIPSKLLFQLDLPFLTCKIYKIKSLNFILDLPPMIVSNIHILRYYRPHGHLCLASWIQICKRKNMMQELLGFFLVANDETRRNVNSLIKVTTFQYLSSLTIYKQIVIIFGKIVYKTFKMMVNDEMRRKVNS